MSAKPAPAKDAAPAEAGGKSLVSKLKIPGIILAVIVVEWVGASMYMSKSAPPAAAAHASSDDEEHEEGDEESSEHGEEASDHGGGHGGGHGGHGKEEKEKGGHGGGHGGHGAAEEKPKVSYSDQHEVDLGEFSVTSYQPVSNSTLFITFHLYGTIKRKHNDEFSNRMDENKHRIRDNVLIIIRGAEITDLTDAGLGLIKRRILETTNKTLGKPLLQGVVFSDFSFVEQ